MKTLKKYVRNSDCNKWHWKVECPEYPSSSNIVGMICTEEVNFLELCPICMKLDAKNIKNEANTKSKKD